MVLGENLNGKVIVEDVDILVGSNSLYERGLNLMPRVVGMVQDAELGVSALAMQVEVALLVLVKVYAPVNQGTNLLGCLRDYLLHGLGVTQPVTRHHSVVYVFLKVVYFKVGHRCYAALRQVGVGLLEGTLADESD